MVSMRARWIWFASALLALLLAGPAVAQEGELKWEDAPAEGDDPAASQSVAPTPAPAPAAPAAQYDDRDPRALTDFAAELEPYGYWRDDPTYGRVWVPNESAVGANFAPYVTSGHWALDTNGDWIWVSDYSFGWVVFHYGRWVWISGVGWAWIPGRQYAPAWVVWRVGSPGYAYVGWAPMPPEYVWVDGVAVGVWFGLYTPWVFCPSAYVYHHHMHSYIVHDHHHVHAIASHTHRYTPPRGKPAWHGPSPKTAHVPAKAVPKHRTAANPKAAAASRPSGASAKVIKPGGRPELGSGTRRAAPTPRRIESSRSLGSSDQPLRTTRPSPSAPAASRGPAPVSPAAAPPSRVYTPPPTYSAPSRSAPSYSAPSYSAPSRSYSAPSRSESKPSKSWSPSRSSSGSFRAPSAPIRPAPAPARPSGPSRGGRGGRR